MTFTKQAEKKARKGYLEVVLPSLQGSAEGIALEGLRMLLDECTRNGLTSNEIWIPYTGYTERLHQLTIAKLIRKKVFIDVRVDKGDKGYRFKLAPFYSHNTGALGYKEPLYRVQIGTRERDGLYTNVGYLKRKKVNGVRNLALIRVCDFFNITERHTEFLSDYKPPKGIECNYQRRDYLQLIEVVLICMQKHPDRILELHQSGNHAKIYDQLNFKTQDSCDPWTDEKRDGCVAQLTRRLLK